MPHFYGVSCHIDHITIQSITPSFFKSRHPGINILLPTFQTSYSSPVSPVLSVSTWQIIPISRQVVRTTRQVTTIHPADNRDQPGDNFNSLPFYTEPVRFSNIFLRNASDNVQY